MKVAYIYIIIIILNSTCKHKVHNQLSNAAGNNCRVISITGFEDKANLLSSIYERIEYVPLESNPKALLGALKKILIQNDTILIKVENSNSNSYLFSFDIKGKFISSIGKIGKGPGEYINPMDILVESNSSTVEVIDAVLMKIIKYDLKGNFLSESKISFIGSPFNFSKNDDYSYFYYMSNNTIDKNNSYNLYLVNINGKIMNKYLPILEQYENLRLISPNNLLNTPVGKFVVPSPSFTIYELSDNNIRESFCFHFGELMVPMEGLKLDSDREKIEFFNNNKYITGVSDFLISSNILFITIFYDRKFIYFWYDLEKNTFLSYKYNSNPKFDDVLINYPYPFTVYNDYFVSWQPPHEMNLEGLNKVMGISNEGRKVTNNSNPILIFSKLKANLDNE